VLTWAINDQEQVVGISRAGGDHAGVWQNGAYRELPDAGYSWAHDINDNGWVAGGSGSDITAVYAALWKGGQLELYGPGYANAINNAGVAVGYWEGTQHAMLYSGGHTYDLNTLWDRSGWDGWSLRVTEDINDAGEIVAIASNAATFAQQAVLLSPVPELAPALMLLAGLALLGSLHRAIARNAIAPLRTI
jgi:probable HAF family extracellular repeat protein